MIVNATYACDQIQCREELSTSLSPERMNQVYGWIVADGKHYCRKHAHKATSSSNEDNRPQRPKCGGAEVCSVDQ